MSGNAISASKVEICSRTNCCLWRGNDITLFAMGNERGMIVGNARPESLQRHNQYPVNHRYLARDFCAGGILEGLKYFGFLE